MRDKLLKRIIDRSKDEYKDFPHTLEGQFLIRKVYTESGDFLGYITADPDYALDVLSDRTKAKNAGWENIYDEIDKSDR